MVGNSYSYAIYNEYDGEIEVNDGLVEIISLVSSHGNNYGIYNKNTGNIVINGGRISCNSRDANAYGIYNNTTGNITIGVKGDGVVSNTNPSIKAVKSSTSSNFVAYGVYNNKGTFNFYDGIISGETLAYFDMMTEREENTTLLYNDDKTEMTLSTEPIALVKIEDVGYASLQEAINACESGETIELLQDIDFAANDEELIVARNKNVVIDLRGNKISSTISNNVIENNGILEIRDSIGGGMIVTIEETTICNKEGATLKITGGAIDNRNTQAIYNEGDLIVDGGKINYKNSSIYAIYNAGNGTIQLNDGEFKAGTTTIYNTSVEKIEINGGKITGKYGIYNVSSGNIEINGGQIKASQAIYNAGIGSIEVNEGTVESDSTYHTIYNESSGNIIINGGTISNGIYNYEVIYNASIGGVEINGGTISNSGRNGGNGISNTKGALKYNGGTIKSKYNAISNLLTEIPEGKCIAISVEDEYQVMRLEDIIENVVTIDNIEYSTINKAIKALEDTTGTITLIRDTNIVENTIINETQDITIDLNGYALNNYFSIKNNGNLTIVDSSTGKTGHIVNNYANTVIENNGTFDMNCGTIISKAIYAIKNLGIANVNRVMISGNTYGIYNSGSDAILNMNETIVNENNYGVYNGSGTVNVENATINENTYGVYNIYNGGSININETVINENTYGIYNANSTSATTVTSTNISSNMYGIYDCSGTVTMSSGVLSLNTYGMYSTGTININEVDIELNDYGVYANGGTVNINSNGITNNGYGAYNSGGIIRIFEGTEINSTNVGIQNELGTVYIGESGIMNNNTPIIVGENYGLINGTGANVYFYDGQIKGKQSATQGIIAYTENKYKVANKKEGEYWIDYLALAGTVQTVATVNGVSYSNLQSAINACSEGEMITITLTNGIETDATFTIGEGKTIILDMNEKTISSSAETTIINQGNLTIIDSTSSGVGKISNTNANGTSINNSGTLTLGTDDGTVSQNLITIEGETYGIINSGTLNFYDGVIKGSAALSGTVTSMPSEYTFSTTISSGKEMYFLTR